VQRARLVFLCAGLAAGLLPSCGTSDYGDQPSDPIIPPPAGKGERIHDIANPASKQKASDKDQVAVTGAVVVAVDQFDETHNGKSSGTIYVSDLGSKLPYSGISLFNPSFVTGDLRVGAGDTLDLAGTYQENQTIPVQFAPKAFLIQLATPVATFRFDAAVTDPVDIDINDLADYEKGRRWMNMLVRVKNVTLQTDATPSSAGRVSAGLLPETNSATKCADPFPKAPTLTNELADVASLQLPQGTVIKSLVGVVVFFCNLHVAPRTAADIQL
jgi:hypothetical protein